MIDRYASVMALVLCFVLNIGLITAIILLPSEEQSLPESSSLEEKACE